MVNLNLGCGDKILEGWVNVDCVDYHKPDVVWDLEKTPWPFEDNYAEVIMLSHVLEHLGQSRDSFFNIMKELYRVSAPNAEIHIAVPHPRSDDFLGDPTHVRPITTRMLTTLSQERNRELAAQGCADLPLGKILGVDFKLIDLKVLLDEPWNTKYSKKEISEEAVNFAINHYYNVVKQTSYVLKAVK